MTTTQTIFAFSALGLLFLTLGVITVLALRADREFMTFEEIRERRRRTWRVLRGSVLYALGSAMSQTITAWLTDGLSLSDREKISFAVFGLYTGVFIIWTLMDMRAPLILISLGETPAEKAARMLANINGVTIKLSASTEHATAALTRVSQALNDISLKGGR